MDMIQWLLNLKTGDAVAVLYGGQVLYTEKVKVRYEDMIILENDNMYDEYGDEIDLGSNSSEQKQYLGPLGAV